MSHAAKHPAPNYCSDLPASFQPRHYKSFRMSDESRLFFARSAIRKSLAAPADRFNEAGPACRPPEAADHLSRPDLPSLALLRAELREAVAVHVRLDKPGGAATIGPQGKMEVLS